MRRSIYFIITIIIVVLLVFSAVYFLFLQDELIESSPDKIFLIGEELDEWIQGQSQIETSGLSSKLLWRGTIEFYTGNSTADSHDDYSLMICIWSFSNIDEAKNWYQDLKGGYDSVTGHINMTEITLGDEGYLFCTTPPVTNAQPFSDIAFRENNIVALMDFTTTHSVQRYDEPYRDWMYDIAEMQYNKILENS